MNGDSPQRPLARGPQHYERLKQEITRPARRDLFSLTLDVHTQQQGDNRMNPQKDEPSLTIDFVFKPIEPGLRLTLEQIQLLLAYMGEILRELEAEEQAPSTQEEAPACK